MSVPVDAKSASQLRYRSRLFGIHSSEPTIWNRIRVKDLYIALSIGMSTI